MKRREAVTPFLSFPFLLPLCCLLSPLPPSYLLSSNPIPMLPSASSSPTRTELCVHSLIHDQSYLGSGTIATAQARLETTACRKITPIPQDCWTLYSQPQKPSSLSHPHGKYSSLPVGEKKNTKNKKTNNKKIPLPVDKGIDCCWS